jgi:hypothetical protein
MKENAMEAETETEEALKPETSEQKPVEPVAKPQLVVLTTDDDAVGVCNLDGECL